MVGNYHNIKDHIKGLHAALGRVRATTINNVTILLIYFISHWLIQKASAIQSFSRLLYVFPTLLGQVTA